MSNALLIDMSVSGDRIILVDEFQWRLLQKRYAKKWGDGAFLKCRIEPEEEAWRHADAKHLYGHLYTPVSNRTGETVPEVHLRMKAKFMPDDGRTSITQLNRIEMRQFIEAVEQDIRESDLDSWMDCCAAMALYERRTV